MADVLSTLFVSFRASTDKFNSDLRAAQKEVKEFEKAVKPTTELLKDFGKASVLVGGALVAAFAAAVKSAADYGDNLNDLSKKSGASVESLAKLGFAAQQSGSSMEGAATGLKFLAKNMEAAVSGSKQQIAAFAEAGISAKNLAATHGDVNKVLMVLADQFKRMPDGAEKTALALKLFGKSGAELIPLLDEGSDGIARMGDEAQRLGLVISKDAAAAADEFNDRLAELEGSLKGIALEIGTTLMPAVKELVQDVTEGAVAFRGWIDRNDLVIKSTAGLSAAILGAGGLALALGQAIKLFGALSLTANLTATSLLAIGPAAAVAGAALLGIGIGLAIREWTGFGAVLDSVGEKLGKAFASSAGIEGMSRANEQLSETLKKQGIIVDRGALSVAEWNKQLMAAAQSSDLVRDAAARASKASAELTDWQKRMEAAVVKTRAAKEAAVVTDAAAAEAAKKAAAAQKEWADEVERFRKSLLPTMADLREMVQIVTDATRVTESLSDEMNAMFSDMIQISRQASVALDQETADAAAAAMARIAGLKDIADQGKATYKIMTDASEASLEAQQAGLKKHGDEQRRSAESMQRIWEQATANITSGFVDAFSDVIFHGKSFMKSMVDIAKTTAQSMFKAFLTGLMSPLTSAISKLGKSLAGTLLGSIGGSGKGILGGILGAGGAAAGAAAGAGTAVGVGGATASVIGVTSGAIPAGLGATIGALATNPITIAAAAALAAGLLMKKYIGQGRRTADEFVQNVENPFGRNLASIVDTFDAAKAAGTLTLAQAKASKDALTALWSDFLTASNEFASQGETQNKVVQQAFQSLGEYFGPNLTNVFSKMDAAIAGLPSSAQAGGAGSGIPQTGLATSASQIFAEAVARFDAAVDRAGSGAGADKGVTIQSSYNPTFTFYGVPESLQKAIRDEVEPTLVEDLRNNTRGFAEEVVKILKQIWGGNVTVTNPT